MALQEIEFASSNQRDTVYGWFWTPSMEPVAVVHLIHGLGEHARRYGRLIEFLRDRGIVVVANDHVGHGKTATESGIWVDTGDTGAQTFIQDEHELARLARERFPGLPYIVYGHSWGSMIARVFASSLGDQLSGLILGGIAARWYGIEEVMDRDRLAAAAAENGSAPAEAEFTEALFARFTERFGDDAGPTSWVAVDPEIVADHGVDPLNNFGAPLSTRFVNDFVTTYDQANASDWAQSIPEELPVLILAGDQDPVAGYGVGALTVANALWEAGRTRVTTHIFSGARHEVHNEYATRDTVQHMIVDFIETAWLGPLTTFD